MTPRRLLSVLSLVVVILLAWRIWPSPPPVVRIEPVAATTSAEPSSRDSKASPTAASTEEAYPPPRPPSATAAPKPAVGEDGYYPAPPDLFTRIEGMERSAHAAFLKQLQSELDAGDAAALVSRASGSGFLIAAAGSIEGKLGPFSLQDLEQFLSSLLDDGPRPRIQGYAEQDGESGCVDLFVAPWGSVPLPPTVTPEPSAEPYGEGAPPFLAGPDFRWRFCRVLYGDQEWSWDEWTFGHLAELLAEADVGLGRPLILVRPSGKEAADGDPERASLPEMPSDFPRSTDGRWAVRRFEGTPAPDADGWPTRLEVLRTDGSARWVVDAEMSPTGVCQSARLPLGWSADGAFFFSGYPGCFEGCTRFADSYGIQQFDLATGARRSVPDGSLSPDGRFIAAMVHDERIWWLDMALLEGWVEHRPVRIQGLPSGGDISIGGPVWSPDSRGIALTELEGPCAAERASAIHVFRLSQPRDGATGPMLDYRGRFAREDGIFNAVGWDSDGRIRLRRWDDAGRPTGVWWLHPGTGLFTPGVGGDGP